MSHAGRIARNIAIGLAGLIVALILIAVIVVQTKWFRNYVREAIVSAVNDNVGGRAEIGSFEFDPKSLHVVVRNFVIHGDEPAGSAPFVSIDHIELYLRLFTSFKRLYELSYLGVEKPEVSIVTLPNGRTNIPTPRVKGSSDKTALQTVVDLAVGNFALSHGAIALSSSVSSARQALDVRGRNLQAQLTYNFATRSYSGQLGMEPLYVLNGRNTPVSFKVSLPVKLSSDRIEFNNASISTPLSTIAINGSVDRIKDPRFSGNLKGRIALRDLADAANIPVSHGSGQTPQTINLDASATVSNERISVDNLQVRFGQSTLRASGPLRDPKGNGQMDFQGQLALNELGRVANLSVRPAGIIVLGGKAKFDAADRYDAEGSIEARNVSFQQGARRIQNVNLTSVFHVDPHMVDLTDLQLRAFGGEFAGEFALIDFERYRLTGQLRDLNIQNALLTMGERLPYDGNISGPVDAEGDIKGGSKGLNGTAHLTITPGGRGIPVSGRLNASYNGATDSVMVDNSFVSLPHSRLTLSGALNKRLNVSFTSHDLSDVLALLNKPAPVALGNGGVAEVNATVMGNMSNPRVAGHVTVKNFSVEGRHFDTLQANVAGSPSEARVADGLLARGAMQTHFAGSAGLRNWSASERSAVSLNATVQDGDLADVMALAGQPSEGYSGALSASAQISGTLGNPQGSANLRVSNGMAEGERFNQVRVQVNMVNQAIAIPAAFIDAPAGKINLTAEYRHEPESLMNGRLHAHVQSDALDLAHSEIVQKEQPNAGGTLRLNADVNGTVSSREPAFQLTSVNGDVTARGLRLRGQNYGDLSATASTTGQSVAYTLTSDFAGSAINASGTTELRPDYPTRANATVSNLPIERVLVLAKKTEIPARGMVTGSLQFTGTLSQPQGSAQVNLVRATIYGETIDRATVRASYLAQTIDIPQLEVVSGPSHLQLSGRYDHPAGNLQRGSGRVTVSNSHLDLARLATVQQYRPGLAGSVDLSVNGAATIQEKEPRVLLSALDANVNAAGISAQGKNFGSLKLTANTSGGSRLNFALDSDLAGAAIHGSGNAVLTADYPVDGQLTIQNAQWTRLSDLLGRGNGAPGFEAVADASVRVRGPVLKTDQLNGALAVTRLNVSTVPAPGAGRAGAGRTVAIANQGPIQIALERGTVRIQNAHLSGHNIDLQAGGTMQVFGATQAQAMNLTVNGNVDLGIAQTFNRDSYGSGKVTLDATIRGDTARPLVNGQLVLQKASFGYADLPLGISNANGSVVFNGNSAQVRNLTAESGGGKLNVSGFATYAEAVRFGLRANATNVRVRIQQGVSVASDADIRFAGTTQASLISGDVTVQRVTYAPQSDIGAMLTRSAPPVQSPTAPSPLLDNMRLDIRVRSAAGMDVESSLTESLQASADLRVRGTASDPTVLGRVTISEGKLTFFGATYTVNTGTIAFYNPVRIEPILDVSLKTQAKGVTVTLEVTGPVENMKLSYTSDPPLQFQEIVALLASGKAPTSDPTILANQPTQPQQSFQQLGESAILGQAVANPVASQLQRVFGVTQLKIDPSFTTGSNVPTAQLSMQERITSNLTFTYSSAIDNPNAMLIRVEWAFNPQFSAVATRDQNGLVSVNLFYKKSFR